MLQRPAATQDFDIVLTREGGIKVSALHGFGEQYIAASGYRMLPSACTSGTALQGRRAHLSASCERQGTTAEHLIMRHM